MIDTQKDMKQARSWLNTAEGEMSEDQLVYLAATGFQTCPDFCGSEKYCEDGACACIRATFPTPDHYHCYLLLRSKFLGWTKQGIIAGAIYEDAFDELKARRKQNDTKYINNRSS